PVLRTRNSVPPWRAETESWRVESATDIAIGEAAEAGARVDSFERLAAYFSVTLLGAGPIFGTARNAATGMSTSNDNEAAAGRARRDNETRRRDSLSTASKRPSN